MFSLFDHEVNDFIKKHTRAVLATVDKDGQPYTSTIYYALADKSEIYFVTKEQTTKAKNLLTNERAALTISDNEKPLAVNITGTARKIEDYKKRDEVMQHVFQVSYDKQSDFAPIVKLHKGAFSVFQFHPLQAKMTDFTKPMGQVKEKYKDY
jgi:general stress protein 26